MRERLQTPTLTIPKGEDAESQELTVWPGVVLQATLESVARVGIHNAQRLILVGWRKASLTLRCEETGQEYEVPLAWAAENLRHGAAVCYAAIQGKTCRGTVALWCMQSRRMTRRHLILGLSRATAITKVWLGD